MWKGLFQIVVSDVSDIVLGSTDSGRQQHIAKTSHHVIATRQRKECKRTRVDYSSQEHAPVSCFLKSGPTTSLPPPLNNATVL